MIEVRLDNFDLLAIAESGQCFRFEGLDESTYEVIAQGTVLTVKALGEGRFLFACDEREYERVWRPYFDLDTDYSQYIRCVPAEDAFLSKACAFGNGIRILRQDPWEMLITFIISQQKNIPAIKKAVAVLSERFGESIGTGDVRRYAFPTPKALAARTEADLRDCALGYRAAYVLAAAKMVASGELDLAHMESLDDEALHNRLLTVPGIGPKVANCVMLFGFHRIAAFPRDVWINRIIEQEYQGCFAVERYPGFAGVIQQYMFYYARLGKDRTP